MGGENLSVYLCDHFAGSVAALEVLDQLITAKPEPELESFLTDLRLEIQADQNTLKGFMDHLGVPESKLKGATAWFIEKAGRLKLHSTNANDLGLLLSLEGLILGLKGKEGLWTALSVVIKPETALKEIDFKQLEIRARDQCNAVEFKRLEAARRILAN